VGRVDFVHCVEEWFSLPPIRGKGKPLLGALDGNLAVDISGVAKIVSQSKK